MLSFEQYFESGICYYDEALLDVTISITLNIAYTDLL